MAMKVYNKASFEAKKQPKPVISISKAGLFTLNQEAVKMMSLTEGLGVEFLQDEARPKDFFLRSAKKDGFKLRGKVTKSGLSGMLMFNSREMAGTIFRFTGHDKKAKFRIGPSNGTLDERDYFPIITAAPVLKDY